MVPGGVVGARHPRNFIEGEYPIFWSQVRAETDIDGNEYIDLMCGYGPISLGYREKEVDDAVIEMIREKGFTILTGMGSDPGTNNLIAKYYAEKLDTVDEIAISIADLSERGTWGVAWDHRLYMNIGNIPRFINGKIEYVPAGSGKEEVEFPEPLGKCKLHYVGHPQPVTIPRYMKNVNTVTIKGVFCRSGSISS